ncbi:MAG: 5'-nucleotidase C-terminal domain-containing protein [Burkholderiales bacterium]|jgi:5'-nucleotidase|nr:5'-nucleotidase C-terminal domain-containing protein [Burkholderiales bacterium]
MLRRSLVRALRRTSASLLVAAFASAQALAFPIAEGLSILHVGDQESWLISAQGNLRDNGTQALSFYGGVDRLAAVMAREQAEAQAAGRSVLKLNAGDAFLPGPRFNASLQNLASALNGGQDYYDAIAMRQIGFTATVFGNHEFDLGPTTAARFAEVSGTRYLSANIDYSSNADLAALASAGKVGASMVVTTDKGNKVGIVGVTTPLLPQISSPGDVKLLGYTSGATEQANLNALAPLVQAQVDSLRAQGATAVILMSHLQNVQNELAVIVPQLKGVDIVVSGGGHELMSNPSDPLLAGETKPNAPLDQYPVAVKDADGKPVLTVTANFGNRYLGVLNISLDGDGKVIRDGNGVPVVDAGSGMNRVSGAAADPDRVAPDAFLNQAVVTPVQQFIAALNAKIIGVSEVFLNGARGSAGSVGPLTPGVRNAETNLGNLVADALRWVAGTDVALQNGGGIRASVNAGNVSVGDTFNVLTFTNLVVAAKTMTAAQLRDALEHGLGRATPAGFVDGRFPQLSGLKVVYDSARALGTRIISLVLDDGTVLVSDGKVVPDARTFSFATIDFLANGGDGYPFPALPGLDFDNLVKTLTYQEALELFIAAPVSEGGLGGVISASRYGAASPFDAAGRLIDVAVAAVPEPGVVVLVSVALVGLAAARRRRSV